MKLSVLHENKTMVGLRVGIYNDPLPANLDEYEGSLDVGGHQLDTLEGAPRRVDGSFWCFNNNLKTLEGGPQFITRNYNCSQNSLTSLKGAPRIIQGDFNCDQNLLETLEDGPIEVKGNFTCDGNKLTSLKGCPKKVGGYFEMRENKITSFVGIPDTKVILAHDNLISSFDGLPQKLIHLSVTVNKFKSLENIETHIKEIQSLIQFQSNPIKSHILGLCLIEGSFTVNFSDAKLGQIMNANKNDIYTCQSALIEAGYEEFAQL